MFQFPENVPLGHQGTKPDTVLWDAQGRSVVPGGALQAWEWFGDAFGGDSVMKADIALTSAHFIRCNELTGSGWSCQRGNELYAGCRDYCTSPHGCPEWTPFLLSRLLRALGMEADLSVPSKLANGAPVKVTVVLERLRLYLTDGDGRELFSMDQSEDRWNVATPPGAEGFLDASIAGMTQFDTRDFADFVGRRHLCHAMHRPEVRTLHLEFRYTAIDPPGAERWMQKDATRIPELNLFRTLGRDHRPALLTFAFVWEVGPQTLTAHIAVR